MPQIHLEYSANCQPDAAFPTLFQKIHLALTEIAEIKLENCKSRAICQNDYYIANGDAAHAFAHLSIRFVEGRTTAVKNQLGDSCLKLLQDFFADAMDSLELQLTVEIRDISLADYHKYPEGTLTKQA